jgi:hypothetical protein
VSLVKIRRDGRPRRERGAVAALVAILLAGNVALGMAALVVDVGLLYVEREQLQTGADSGSLAVAAACAEQPANCTQSEMEFLAEAGYAATNAGDGLADATVCGNGLPYLTECDTIPPIGNLTDCLPVPPDVPTSAPYVEVHTKTQAADGPLPPAFAGIFTGYTGTYVGACSRVTWGPADEAPVRPAMAIPLAVWENATLHGTQYQPRPASASSPYDGVDWHREVSLRWRSPTDGLVAGFGWLAGAGADCRLTVSASNLYGGWTDESVPDGCDGALINARAAARPVNVAIVDQVAGDSYRVAGIARFVVTGWFGNGSWSGGPTPNSAPSDVDESPLNGASSCPGEGEGFCVFGYFTAGVLAVGTGALGASDYGAIYLRTIG